MTMRATTFSVSFECNRDSILEQLPNMFRTTARTAALVIATLFANHAAAAQEALGDRLTIHGSLNAGYGKSDGLPVFGINQDGTSNYRAIAIQFGYKINDKSRVVTQFLSRDFGTSPLQAAEKSMFPVWAFFEQKFDNGVSVKVGRNPLPRGIFNEVRFVGTLLPFYRVGSAVYGETLEYIDGAVVSKRFDLGQGFKLEANGIAGGSDLKAIVPSASGTTTVYKIRLENLVGTQLWLNTPIKGVRIGEFLASYMSTPRASLPESQRGGRTLSTLTSVNGVWTKAFARGEFETFTSSKPTKSKYAAYYVQAGVTPIEQFTFAGEYTSTTNRITLPSPYKTFDLNLGTDAALGATWKPSAQVAFKLEGHKAEGYTFDVPVPTVVLPTTSPFNAHGAPRRTAYYGIASVAVSF